MDAGSTSARPGRLTTGLTRSLVPALALLIPASLFAQRPAILDRAVLDPSVGVNFQALATPDTVWVGEQVNYEVGVFMNEDVRSRLRRNPEFMPPELRAMLAYDLPTHQSFVPLRGVPGAQLEAYVFRRALFPLQAGRHDIPAATLAYSLPLSRSFFSREESFTRRTKPVTVHVLALPPAGQPPDFDGAVGRLRVETVVDTVPSRVGDPLRLTVKVRGEGNVNLLPRPRLAIPWATITPTRERVQVDDRGSVIRGTKEFDWLVTPRDDGVQIVPAVRYPYFDPSDASYKFSVAGPVQVTVRPGVLAAAEETDDREAELLPIRTDWRGALPEPPAEHDAFWLLALLAPLPAVGVAVARGWRRGPKAAPGADESLYALAALLGAPSGIREQDRVMPGSSVSLARQARRLAMLSISRRLDVPLLPLTRQGELTWLLRRVGVSDEAARECESVLVELDRIAYGHFEPDELAKEHVAGLVRRAAASVAAVDAEASHRSLARRALDSRRLSGIGFTMLGCVIIAGASLAGAMNDDRPAELFAEGVRTYADGDAHYARAAFHRAARAESRAADAWANYGTASWVVGDTASAVVGWHRALRLEPDADDLRPRLALVPGASASRYAEVPSIPPAPLQLLALGAWVVASLALALAIFRRRHSASLPAVAALTVAVISAGAAAWVHQRTDASRLAVIASTGNTRAAPALGAEPGVSVVSGEIVRVLRSEGVWSRVAVERGTSGWLEASQLMPLHD